MFEANRSLGYDSFCSTQRIQYSPRIAFNHIQKNQRGTAGRTVAALPVAQGGDLKAKPCCELFLRQAQAFAQA